MGAKPKRSLILSLRQNPHWSLLCRKKPRAVHNLHGIEEEPKNTNSVLKPRHAQDPTVATKQYAIPGVDSSDVEEKFVAVGYDFAADLVTFFRPPVHYDSIPPPRLPRAAPAVFG